MEENLKVGEVVELNSGSPRLTVTRLFSAFGAPDTVDTIEVAWIDGTTKRSFIASALCFKRSDQKEKFLDIDMVNP